MPSSDFTPREIVSELDKYIIGQKEAKRAVAIALRNRWRRQQVPEDLRDEILPKNIIMIGPTGVGKTEIARRIAKLARAPFIKVEASKFTEVGYMGKDVESMIRDLTDISVKMVREEATQRVQARAREQAEERLLDMLLPLQKKIDVPAEQEQSAQAEADKQKQSREKLRQMYREGKLDKRSVEFQHEQGRGPMPMVEVVASGSPEEMGMNLKEMFGQIMSGMQPRKRRMKVPEAMDVLVQEEAAKLIDMDEVMRDAILRVEQKGIVFLDEIDKIAGKERGNGPDVSRSGVQRDILPIVEGSTVMTKHGLVRTDHILFIAAGAFHMAKPADLIPELQGRFPIRVELKPLSKDEFFRILTEPTNSLTKQYSAMLKTEKVELTFAEAGLKEICQIASEVNEQIEDIGARRLHTILEKVLEEPLFNAPDKQSDSLVVDQAYVQERLSDVVKNRDLSRYIL